MIGAVALLILAPPATVTGAPKLVTSAYVRMNDPGYVARALRDGDGVRARGLMSTLAPPELIARRSALVARLTPAFRLLDTATASPVKRTGKEPAPGAVAPVKPPISKDIVANYADLFPELADLVVPLDMGTAVRSAEGEVVRTYEGVAPRDGTLSVREDRDRGIVVTRLVSYTGEVGPGGEPVEAGVARGLVGIRRGLAVRAGQAYKVVVRMRTGEVGDKSEEISVQDGGRAVKLTVRGSVVPATGVLSATLEEGDFTMLPGTTRVGKLRVTVDGNGQTNLVLARVGGAGDGVSVRSGPLPVRRNGEITFYFEVVADKFAADGPRTLSLKLSGYDGSAVRTVSVPARLETVWTIWENYTQSEQKVKTKGTFKFSNSGFWDHTVFAETDAILFSDFVGSAVHIDTRVGNKRLGTLVDGWLSAKMQLGAGARTFRKSGWDVRLVENGAALMGARSTATIWVDDEWDLKAAAAARNYWFTSNPILELKQGG